MKQSFLCSALLSSSRKSDGQCKQRWQRACGLGLQALHQTGVYQLSHGISSNMHLLKSLKTPTNIFSLISFTFSILVRSYWMKAVYIFIKYNEQGLSSSIATTLNTPLLLGGPSSVGLSYINKYEPHLIHWLRWYGVGFLELRCASRLVLALRRLSVHIQRVVDCKLSKFLRPILSSWCWLLLATQRLHILYRGNIKQERVFFIYIVSDVVVDSE